MMIVDATKDLAAAYKPNLAFFEEWGSKGLLLARKFNETYWK